MNTCIEHRVQEEGRQRQDRIFQPDGTRPEVEDLFSLPADLREWVDAYTLVAWIEEATQKLDWDNPEVVAYLHRHPSYRPRTMLCLLAYAYATEVFGAEEIVRRCYTDDIFQLICEKVPPDAARLSTFRRDNRGLLKGVLVPVLIRAVAARFELGEMWIPPGLKRYLLDNVVERLDVARHVDNTGE